MLTARNEDFGCVVFSELDSLIIQPSSSLLDSIITTYLKTNEFLEFLHKQIMGCSLVLEFGLLFSRC